MNLTTLKKPCRLLLTLVLLCVSYPAYAAGPPGWDGDGANPTPKPVDTSKTKDGEKKQDQQPSPYSPQEQTATKLFDNATYESFINRDDTPPPFDQSYLLEPRL